MTFRDNYTKEQQEAAHLLDLVRAGGLASDDSIRWALWVLWDLVE